MKKYIVLAFATMLAFAANSQTVEDFEAVTLDSGKVLNGKTGENEYKFLSGLLTFPVSYDTSFGGYWSSGWAISRKIDSATVKSSSSRHLFCAKPGKGFGNSNTFVVGQNGSAFSYPWTSGSALTGFYISNSTYTYNSMKLGDFFGKKFGGKTGKDLDYLFVRVKSWVKNQLKDSQDVYLADFRFADSTKDYILKDWNKVVLSPWRTDSVSFEMYGSDTGIYGLNTPAFFVIDNVSIDRLENVSRRANLQVSLFPNPASNAIKIASSSKLLNYKILNILGIEIKSSVTNEGIENIDLAGFTTGTYIFIGETADGFMHAKFEVIR